MVSVGVEMFSAIYFGIPTWPLTLLFLSTKRKPLWNRDSGSSKMSSKIHSGCLWFLHYTGSTFHQTQLVSVDELFDMYTKIIKFIPLPAISMYYIFRFRVLENSE